MLRVHVGLVAVAFVAGACRAAAPPATTPSVVTVTSSPMTVTPATPLMCHAEKPYFAVADPISVACAPNGGLEAFAPKFELGASAIAEEDVAPLRRLAECATKGPLAGRTLTLVGHADPRGQVAENKSLGLERAERVRDALVAAGMDRSRLHVTSRGDREAEGADETSWANDRRVDIVLADGD